MFETIQAILTRIKREKPLILNITNAVTMDFIANGLLSLGASPVMSHAPQEADDLVNIASAVVINPGTLNDAFIALSTQVCHSANAYKKPIILDPVGAGASLYRTATCRQLLDTFAIAIVRGNASEIMALAGVALNTKGVDSTTETQLAIDSAQALARDYNVTVVISGRVDVIVDAHHIQHCDRGSPLMPTITGTGCLLSSVVAAFHAVHENRVEAATAAAVFYGVCGELAAKNATKPGSFKVQFLDALYLMPMRGDYANH